MSILNTSYFSVNVLHMMAVVTNDPSRLYDSCSNIVLLLEGAAEPYFAAALCLLTVLRA